MEDWQRRVIDEHKDLCERITKIAGFISSSPDFQALDVVDRELLRQQRDVMRDYEIVLEHRIARFRNGQDRG